MYHGRRLKLDTEGIGQTPVRPVAKSEPVQDRSALDRRGDAIPLVTHLVITLSRGMEACRADHEFGSLSVSPDTDRPYLQRQYGD